MPPRERPWLRVRSFTEAPASKAASNCASSAALQGLPAIGGRLLRAEGAGGAKGAVRSVGADVLEGTDEGKGGDVIDEPDEPDGAIGVNSGDSGDWPAAPTCRPTACKALDARYSARTIWALFPNTLSSGRTSPVEGSTPLASVSMMCCASMNVTMSSC